jgi:uncharacterized protein YbjT (DUF2867 family)
MKIVVIGGSGLIGSKLVTKLREHGHEAVAASPNTGVNTLTGEGLADALANATVVIDVSNSPSFEDAPALEFFETSTRNLLAAEAAAGVGHHVALSVVGTERLQQSGYFRAKSAQEKLIENSAIPYSIVHATQFFEFVRSMADAATDGSTVRFAPVLFQPIAGDEVAQAVGRIAVGSPLNGIAEVAGPEQFRMDEFFRGALATRADERRIPERRDSSRLRDRIDLIGLRRSGGERSRMDVERGEVVERVREQVERAGFARYAYAAGREHVPELIVPDILREAARQPQPLPVLTAAVGFPERAQRPRERRDGCRVPLGEPRHKGVEEPVGRARGRHPVRRARRLGHLTLIRAGAEVDRPGEIGGPYLVGFPARERDGTAKS